MRQDGRSRGFPDPERASLFSRVFNIDDPERAAWFDPVLLKDNPVFIDPFLLDITNEPEFRGASREVFEHFQSLYRAVAENPRADVEQYLNFPEVAETCLGFTKVGTSGSGSGRSRAAEMREAIGRAIAAGLKSPEHFEEIALLAPRIGRDLISDITTRILMARFMAYTERVARDLGIDTHETRLWGYEAKGDEVVREVYVRDLPRNPHSRKRHAVLLVPKLLLRELPTINKYGFEDYLYELHSDELVSRFNVAVKKNLRPLVLEIARKNPGWVRDYTAWEESRGARPYSFEKDPLAVGATYRAFYELGLALAGAPGHPRTAGEVMGFVRFLTRTFKKHVEDSDGWKDMYQDIAFLQPKTEEAVQRLFAGMSRGACELAQVRMSRESYAGAGFVDFLFVTNYSATVLLEAKLIKNGKFWDGIGAQLPRYLRSHDAKAGMLLAVAFSEREVKMDRYIGLLDYVKQVGTTLGLDLEGERVDARPQRIPPSKLKTDIAASRKRSTRKQGSDERGRRV